MAAHRRSAVSRQACRAVGRMAAVMGLAAEPALTALIPDILKVVVITVQVQGTGRRVDLLATC